MKWFNRFAPVVLGALLLTVLTGGGAVLGQSKVSADDLIFVVQDETAVEQQIKAYFERKEYKCTMIFLGENEDDGVLQVPWGLDPEPDLDVYVDTLIAARDGDDVTERVIRVFAWYKLPEALKTPEARRRILELNNQYMEEKWAPARIVIDKDGDILLETFVNIPAQKVPIHAEMINDVMLRLLNGWGNYWEVLKKEFGDKLSD